MNKEMKNKDKEDYGDFEELTEGGVGSASVAGEGFVRVRMPRGRELIGIIVQRFGGNRMEVLASDGKKRNCRVPGRFKRSMWLRPNDIVLIQPWQDDDEKGDIIFHYHSSAVNQLRKKGLLNSLKVDF